MCDSCRTWVINYTNGIGNNHIYPKGYFAPEKSQNAAIYSGALINSKTGYNTVTVIVKEFGPLPGAKINCFHFDSPEMAAAFGKSLLGHCEEARVANASLNKQ